MSLCCVISNPNVSLNCLQWDNNNRSFFMYHHKQEFGSQNFSLKMREFGVGAKLLCEERWEERKGARQRKKESGGVWCERSEALRCCLIPSSFLSPSLFVTWRPKLKQISKWCIKRTRANTHIQENSLTCHPFNSRAVAFVDLQDQDFQNFRLKFLKLKLKINNSEL